MKFIQLAFDFFSDPNQLKLDLKEETKEETKSDYQTKPKLSNFNFNEIKYTDPNKPARKRFFYF